MKKITQEKLKELLHYNEDSGVFTRLVATNKRLKVGDVAGSLNKSTGYIHIKIDGKLYQAHRLAYLYMEGEFPPETIDHINRNRDDNRYVNLRAVSQQENLKNRSKHSNNTSGVVGVYWAKASSRWSAQINVDGKHIYLGSYELFSEAVDTRKLAEVAYGYYNQEDAA